MTIVEASRTCSRCGWTLPAQYSGYVGPCPECSGRPLPHPDLEERNRNRREELEAGFDSRWPDEGAKP